MIKSLKDLQEMPVMVRVLDSTNNPTEGTKKMIGGEFEIRRISYHDKTIAVYNKNKYTWYDFNFSDVQFLTPVEFNGKKIGIGDIVVFNGNQYEVYGYHWYSDKFYLKTAKNKDYSICWNLSVSEIESVIPLYKPEPEPLSGKTITVTIDGKDYEAVVK